MYGMYANLPDPGQADRDAAAAQILASRAARAHKGGMIQRGIIATIVGVVWIIAAVQIAQRLPLPTNTQADQMFVAIAISPLIWWCTVVGWRDLGLYWYRFAMVTFVGRRWMEAPARFVVITAWTILVVLCLWASQLPMWSPLMLLPFVLGAARGAREVLIK